MQARIRENTSGKSPDIMHAVDCLQLMLLEFGDQRIENLGQLLRLTNVAEREYAHICNHRRFG